MPIRLIGIDIDGTLLDSRGTLPPGNRTAIEKAVAAGIDVALVTGRSFHFARPIADTLPDELMLIVSNGALVKSKSGQTKLRRLLPNAVARDVLAGTLAFRDAAALIFDRPRKSQVVCERMNWQDPNRRGYFERNRECISEILPLEDALTEDPIQVMFNGSVGPMRALSDILHALPSAGRFEVALTEYEHRDFTLLDVMTRGCTKGSALAEWAAARGIARDEVMAIGDNFNDREMLEFAGVPVVMGNAVPALKALGWALTASNDEGGLAAAIDAFALSPGSSR